MPTPTATQSEAELRVTAELVNCRFGPGTVYELINELSQGQSARVVGRDVSSTWWYIHDPGNPASISDDYVTAIHEARGGQLLVGTRSGGLNVLDRRTGRFRRGTADRNRPDALSHHSVTSIVEDAAGAVWIGTSGGGLNRLAPDGPDGAMRFERVTAKDGLVDDNVMALEADDDGSLWVATRAGLSRFDPRRRVFRNYDVADGLLHPKDMVEQWAAEMAKGKEMKFAEGYKVVTLVIDDEWVKSMPS